MSTLRERILTLIADRPGLQAREIAQALGVSYLWACKNLKRLRTAGVVRRTTVAGKTAPLYLYDLADYPKPTRTNA